MQHGSWKPGSSHGIGSIGLNPGLMRLLRLARLIRMLKLLQVLSAFETLFVLIRSIKASFGALIWSFVLLLCMQLTVGLLLCQLLSEEIKEGGSMEEDKRREIFGYFGTFTNSLLSMFQVSLATWVPICRLLYVDVSEFYGLFIVVYRCMLCFAVVKTITAVFISETQKAAAGDMEILAIKKQKEREKNSVVFKDIFKEFDSSGDGQGTVKWDDFQQLIHDEVIRPLLQKCELDPSDLEQLFQIFDSGNGTIEVDEFIDGMGRMKGSARSMDVVALLKMTQRNQAKIDKIMRVVCAKTGNGHGRATA
eukprot:gnl/TRDRNA2_/TRDRNA2_137616_c0_seq2.p1 gnl/TRDRNA2_/TRDRNA2_137616_c0~~gnl/TRDRNA2_/TRDRNA2_137616_c0_seq2.p1  ORF type:complete len:307 (+),score=56.49 gnl/TRDRNA2_/TRDRNA2_137616_c0_seq2:135-1055(+)